VLLTWIWFERTGPWAGRTHTQLSVKTGRKESERAVWNDWAKARHGGRQWEEGKCEWCLSVCVCVCVHAWRGRGGSPVSELHSFGPSHWCVFQTGGYVKGNRIFVLSMSLSHTHKPVNSLLVFRGGHAAVESVQRSSSACEGQYVWAGGWDLARRPLLPFPSYSSRRMFSLLVLGCSFTFSLFHCILAHVSSSSAPFWLERAEILNRLR